MFVITLKDGSKKECAKPLTVGELAAEIGAGLAKAALAGKVDDKLVDLSYLLEGDAEVSIITAKDPEGVDILRHSAAHLMAHAVHELFPSAIPTIGPVIEDGFYYDFAFEDSFTESDLETIEKRMREIAKRALDVQRKVLTRKEAVSLFNKLDDKYKVELIEELPEDQEITVYEQGDFVDLCRGPHIPNTSHLKAFKLTKVSGAYWRGDVKNDALQRIYGTAWATQKDLDAYLLRIEEAKKRDHRLLGQKMELFHFQPEAAGMAFWHPNGWALYKAIRDHVSERVKSFGYQEVSTPLILDKSLWEKSGHWDKYAENMFVTEAEEHMFAIKPMNCPAHVQIFKQGLKSYRDLPLRLAEFGCCHRKEYSGTLHGLMRVRKFTQDDAHIFCTEEQIASEAEAYIDQILSIYAGFGFHDIMICLSTRPEKRIGEEATWDKAEEALTNALNNKGIDWTIAEGDGAFYGPKIDFSLRDSLGRVWQCGTLQLDFSMPGRLGASYVAEDGTKKVPVMLHRAMLGSLERFIGILTEECEGKYPLWMAPIQAVILNITDKQAEYVAKITEKLRNLGFRVNSDLRNEKIGYKIRQHTLQKVPYALIIGDKEVAASNVAVRNMRSGEDLGSMSLDAFIEIMSKEVSH